MIIDLMEFKLNRKANMEQLQEMKLVSGDTTFDVKRITLDPVMDVFYIPVERKVIEKMISDKENNLAVYLEIPHLSINKVLKLNELQDIKEKKIISL